MNNLYDLSTTYTLPDLNRTELKVKYIKQELKEANIPYSVYNHRDAYYIVGKDNDAIVGYVWPFSFLRYDNYYQLSTDRSLHPTIYLKIKNLFEKYCIDNKLNKFNISIQYGASVSVSKWELFGYDHHPLITNQYTLNNFVKFLISNANYLKINTI